MPFCSYCGNEVHEKAVVCVKCGCPVNKPQSVSGSGTPAQSNPFAESRNIVATISQRIQINGIIWCVIAGLQILSGIAVNWVLLIIGALNLVSAIQDLNYSKSFPQRPVGIVAKVRPLTGPIITLVYNLVFGGVIGVAGSVYYFLAVRGYVLENEQAFLEVENSQLSGDY